MRAEALGRLAARCGQRLEACPYPRTGTWGRLLRGHWMVALAEAAGLDVLALLWRAQQLDELSWRVVGTATHRPVTPGPRHARQWICRGREVGADLDVYRTRSRPFAGAVRLGAPRLDTVLVRLRKVRRASRRRSTLASLTLDPTLAAGPHSSRVGFLVVDL